MDPKFIVLVVPLNKSMSLVCPNVSYSNAPNAFDKLEDMSTHTTSFMSFYTRHFVDENSFYIQNFKYHAFR
jgi:hypothetical protein